MVTYLNRACIATLAPDIMRELALSKELFDVLPAPAERAMRPRARRRTAHPEEQIGHPRFELRRNGRIPVGRRHRHRRTPA
jgi:hypothetical protein